MDRRVTEKAAGLRRRSLGHAIRMARLRTGADLASMLEMPPNLLNMWEEGELSPSLEDVYAIEAAMGLPHGFLAASAGYDIRLASGQDPTDPCVARWVEPFEPSSLVRAVASVSREGLGLWLANRLIPAAHPFETPRVEWVATVTSKPPIAH